MAFRDTWKRMNWLRVAGTVTLAYATWIVWVLGWERIRGFFQNTGTELNAVGDFLAGTFAPVALIWLCAAVLTQRQELNDTRDQFAESKRVTDEQLKVIHSQNALLALQHNQAVENAKKAYKVSLFDKRFQIYEKFIAFDNEHDPNGPLPKDYDKDSYQTMVRLMHEASFVFDKAIADWLWEIAVQIDEYLTFIASHPLELGNDGHGNMIELNNAENAHIRTMRGGLRDAIRDHFEPANRIEMFWRYLDVSDQPLIAG
ncbi:hypothetical protein [Sinorhizobium meliloti]|uniref:Phage abortive infection protein n=1 Tax=Rhizobium meliloti TaxID=382 RepID=A0AAW9TDK6_RHIML|nr:hypothetical protein [Sinorhizobium meliloti]MQW31886.1 hypothetical protein [Sinorhizobium meliloti]